MPLIRKRRIWWEPVPEATSYVVYVSKDDKIYDPAKFLWENTPDIVSKVVIGKMELIVPDQWPEFPTESGTYYIGITSRDDLGNQSDPIIAAVQIPCPVGSVERWDRKSLIERNVLKGIKKSTNGLLSESNRWRL
jgi:hypothetical protein